MQISAASGGRYTRELPQPTSDSEITDAQERRGTRLSDSDLSYGKPRSSLESDSEDRRDFTIKATRRPVPTLPTPTFPPSLSASTSVPPPEIPFPSFSSPTPLTPSRRGNHQHNSSTSSSNSQHAYIPDPIYPVRNQPIGFQSASRSRSNSSLNHSDSEAGSELKRGPSISGGMRPRERNSSFSSSHSNNDSDQDADGEKWNEIGDERENRPLARIRSDSLPVFPPASPIPGEVEELERQREKREKDLSMLPPNPKNWLPSHLATYLSHTLSTTPTSQTTLALHPLISADITTFIRSSHLSGRSFLRLKDSDLDELGINKKWKPLLSLVREKLRREVLGGKIWGFGSDASSNNDGREQVEKVEEKVEAEEEGEKENWKMSWRKLSSQNSKGGRVKGMAQAFESPLPATPSSPTLSSTSSRYSDREGGRGNVSFQSMFGESRRSHRRNYSNSSTTSTASIDSGSGNDHFSSEIGKGDEFDSASQLQFYNQQQQQLSKEDSVDPNITPHRTISNLPDVPTEAVDSPSQYQSNISSHSKPYGLVRKPSASNKTASNSISGSLETTPSKVTSRNSRRGITNINKEDRSTELAEEESWKGDETLRSPILQETLSGPPTSNSRKSSKSNSNNNRSALEGLFGLEIPQSTSTIINEAERRRILSEDLEIMTIQIGGGDDSDGKKNKGSMVLVRRDQFQDLQRRLAEVETQLAEVISSSGTSRATSPISQDYQHSRDGSFASTSNSNTNGSGNDSNSPMGWTQLGGYMFAASIGIGIVAGEVIVGKLFGFRRR